MEKLKLVHTKDKFSLVIGDQEIKSVCSYKITSDAKYPGHVDLELGLKLEVEKILIEQSSKKIALNGLEIMKAINEELRQKKNCSMCNGKIEATDNYCSYCGLLLK